MAPSTHHQSDGTLDRGLVLIPPSGLEHRVDPGPQPLVRRGGSLICAQPRRDQYWFILSISDPSQLPRDLMMVRLTVDSRNLTEPSLNTAFAPPRAYEEPRGHSGRSKTRLPSR
jgi:hypothetical protein